MSESQETSDYPGSLDTWVSLTDKEDLAEASDINKIKAAIEAVQTEIGTDPAGTKTDLVARLAVLLEADGSLRQGTSFPASPAEGDMFYRTDEDTLYIYDGSEWDSVGITLSNVIFNYHGNVVNTTSKGEYSGTSLNPADAAGVYRFLQSDATVAETQMTAKWTKIAGINTIRCIPRIWNRSGGQTTTLTINIGGQTQTWTETATSPTWKTANTIDVSSLTDGTTYDILIQLHTSVNSFEAYCSDVTLLGE